MFDKFSRLAEQAATSLSRRQFLGRFGRAAALAAAAGTLLAQPALARRTRKLCHPDYSDGACGNRYVGDKCGPKSKCKEFADLGGGYASCSCVCNNGGPC